MRGRASSAGRRSARGAGAPAGLTPSTHQPGREPPMRALRPSTLPPLVLALWIVAGPRLMADEPYNFSTLASFNSADGVSGSFPTGGVTLDEHGDLFGTTAGGGLYNLGTVYLVPAGTGSIITLASF